MDSSKEKVPAASIVGEDAVEESRDMSKLQRTSSNPLIRAEKAVERRLTVLWHEIEQWQQDNAFIISGYRPTSNSYFKSWASLGYLHNESVNIYTHLIGAIVSIIAFGITYHILQGRYDVANHEDIVVFSCFFLGAAVCLGMSATYHTISNHSSTVARFGNKLDYFGIVFLIWGSFIPSLYYGYAGDAPNFRFFSVVITTIGAATAAVSLLPFFSGTAWRPFRAFMFTTMGLSALWPVAYGVNEYGWQKLWQQMALPWLFAQGALYILGASIYVVRSLPKQCWDFHDLQCCRHVYLRGSTLAPSTYGAVVIRSSMSLCLLRLLRTSWDSSRRSTATTL